MRKRSKFNLSRPINTTLGMGKLYPLGIYNVIPGDTFQCSTNLLIRTTPLLAPLMTPVHVRLHWWYVPFRLVYDNWEEFITGGSDGTSTPTLPYHALGSVSEGSLMDYFGLPAETFGATENILALYTNAYQLIYNEHYRDQDLITAVSIDTADGSCSTPQTIQKCAWPKDLFTTARPWEQRGTEITVPITGADVVGTDDLGYDSGSTTGIIGIGTGDTGMTDSDFRNLYVNWTNSNPKPIGELDGSAGVKVSDLRESLGLQKFMEDMATNGARYVEYLRFLGIKGKHIDARLSLPEYLGGGKSFIQFSEILSTSDSGTSDVGDMKGHGIAIMRSNPFRRFFEEHGCIMPILSVMPQPMYMNGIPREFSLTAKEDWFQHQLAFIGERELLNKEVYAPHGTPDGTFGYVPQYDECRSSYGFVSGNFNSTLNHWHMARDIGSTPALNQTFVECTPTDRVFQSTATDNLLVQCFHRVAARRPIPQRATKKLVG